MKTTTNPKEISMNILTANLTDNHVIEQSAHQISNFARDQVMVTRTRQSPAKHKSPVKVKQVATAPTKLTQKAVAKPKTVVPPALIRLLEESMDLRLTQLGHKLLADFDLSREGLAHVTTSKYLPLLSTKMAAGSKTGGDKSKTSKVAFERYISIRYKDCMVKFACLLLDPADPKGVRFQVEGAEEHFSRGYKKIYELRPYLPHGTKVGANKGGWEYRSFEQATEKFTEIISSFAHRKH